MLRLTSVCLVAALSLGCAYTIVKPVGYDVTRKENQARGFRFYDPQPILFVGCSKTQLSYVPNFNRGYVVQPRAWFARNDFNLHLRDGMLAEADSEIDATAALTFFQELGTEAVKQLPALAALSAELRAQQRQTASVWKFDYDGAGALGGITKLADLGPCPGPAKQSGKKGTRATGGKAG